MWSKKNKEAVCALCIKEEAMLMDDNAKIKLLNTLQFSKKKAVESSTHRVKKAGKGLLPKLSKVVHH